MILKCRKMHQISAVKFECGHLITNCFYSFGCRFLDGLPHFFKNTLNVLWKRFYVFVNGVILYFHNIQTPNKPTYSSFIFWLDYIAGFNTRPINRMVPVWRSRIRNRKGLSITIDSGMEVVPKITAPAAAASVPSSSTATKALCTTP